MRSLWPIALLLLVIGGINWGIVGLFEENLVAEIFGTGTLADLIYILIGIAAVIAIPRLADEF